METNILTCKSSQLNLDVVLNNGQSFRWKKEISSRGNISWIGIAYHCVWRVWRLNEREINFQVLHKFDERTTAKHNCCKSDTELLREYFQLDVDLDKLYVHWKSKDKYFANLIAQCHDLLQGIRILRQDPVETLFAFICSSNNNIARISNMVEKFCELYGTSAEVASQCFYDFPSISQMSEHLQTMEKTLRAAGFGYRAASIAKTVKLLTDDENIFWKNGSAFASPEEWLFSLRSLPYIEAKEHLMRLHGVGDKVADCICLMALDKHEVVPVDRHVFNVTAEIYKPELMSTNGRRATMSKAIYKQIGDFYIDLFGDYAGWAHSVLFSTRLRRFAMNSL